MDPTFTIYILSVFVKVLFFPAYKSSDFEVHRNWLAITHSLPVSKWYYEDTSEWTLDYPPFFAWFEFILSQLASIVDPSIVKIDNLNYGSWSCVVFQRASVIVTEAVLCVAIIDYCRFHQRVYSRDSDLIKTVLSFQLLFNFGLFIVDHIHFQYNGFLFGILLLSVTRIMQNHHIQGALLFAILLNLKHIFLYIAPAYFVYLLKHYCFTSTDGTHSIKVSRPKSFSQLRISNLIILGGLVLSIFGVSFGPFIYKGQLGQVVSRLFPFKRGLCHAYWAPNFWALYNVVDKVLSIAVPRLGLPFLVSTNNTMMSGLVGEMHHQLLPNITPLATMILTLIAMCPPLVRLWYYPSNAQDFLKTLVLCGFASFLFGWHVHEKAIMMLTLPMSFLALEDKSMMRMYLIISFGGHISLFPLLFTSAETPIKVSAFVVFTTFSFLSIPILKQDKHKSSQRAIEGRTLWFPGLTWIDSLLLLMLLLTQVYCLGFHGLGGFMKSLPFLPLLLTSVTCSVVVIKTWILMIVDYTTDSKIKTN